MLWSIRHHKYLAALAALGVTALAVAAWSLPAVMADEGRPAQSAEYCLSIGTALTVISQQGVIAEVLPGGDNATIGPRVIVVDRPVDVGACAGLQAYWGSGAHGRAEAVLVLYTIPPNSTDRQPVTSASSVETRQGPSQFTNRLKTLTPITQPGSYRFVALIEVGAGQGDKGQAGRLEVPFTVEYRVKEPAGAIAGTVYGSDGSRLQGARVRAVPSGDLLAMPALPSPIGGVSLQPDPARPTGDGRLTAVTGADGTYRFEAPPGKYIVVAEAARHKAHWYDGKANKADADKVEVRSGNTAEGVDFRLPSGGDRPPEPEPATKGVIRGKVLTREGAAINGATVQAERTTNAPDRPAGESLTARTNERGVYEIAAPAGLWIVSARAEGRKVQWFDHKDEKSQAAKVEVLAGKTTDGVSFDLGPATDPAPAPTGVVAGRVVNAEGAPIKDAHILVTRLDGRVVADPASPAGDVVAARTNENGYYEARLAVGQWRISAKAELYRQQWYDGKSTAEGAAQLEVAEGRVIDGVNFTLTRLPLAIIKGKVLKADGSPVRNAVVMAVRRGPLASGHTPPTTGPKVYTNEAGEYVIKVEPGHYAVGAAMKPDREGIETTWVWWDGKERIEAADLLPLADQDVREGINFTLP